MTQHRGGRALPTSGRCVYLTLVRVKTQLSKQLAHRRRQFIPVSFAREKMAVCVEGHRYGGMSQQILYLLGRQLTTAARLRIDAPASKEMPEGMRRIFRLSTLIDNASRL